MRVGRFLNRLINPEPDLVEDRQFEDAPAFESRGDIAVEPVPAVDSDVAVPDIKPGPRPEPEPEPESESEQAEVEEVAVTPLVIGVPDESYDDDVEAEPESENGEPDRMFATDKELREAGIDLDTVSELDEASQGPEPEPEPEPVPEAEAEPEPEPEPVAEVESEPEPAQTPASSAVDDELLLAQSAVNAGFIITLATELRTPLSSLRVSYDLLKDPEAIRNNPSESKRLLGNIERSIARLERQASDLLEVGYLRAGSLSLVKQHVDPSEPVLAAMDISRPAAAQRRVSLELELLPDLPVIFADPFRLTQVMTHLLSNAVKFTPVGGSVIIKMAPGGSAPDSQQGEVNEESTPDVLTISVTDNGPGIRETHFERIFEPFYRISGEGIEGGAGVGLGLAIVKGLIELHEGTVWVNSEQGKSTEFGFSIPIA